MVKQNNFFYKQKTWIGFEPHRPNVNDDSFCPLLSYINLVSFCQIHVKDRISMKGIALQLKQDNRTQKMYIS